MDTLVQQEIANFIKNYIQNINDGEIEKIINKHLKILCLIDQNGVWIHKELEEISAKEYNKDKILEFIDEVAHIATQNDYLNIFLRQAKNENFPHLMKKIEMEGAAVIPDLIGWMVVLNQLTKQLFKNHELIPFLQKIWKKNIKIDLKFGLFGIVKFYSMQIAINKVSKDLSSTKERPTDMRLLLAINILEASIQDSILGNSDNAAAGRVLAYSTRKGLTSFDKGRKTVQMEFPHSKKWADLYTVWNLAFGITRPHFPYFFSKLLIPQVNDYAARPELYLYNRLIALYIYENYIFLSKIKFDWKDSALMTLWGKVNRGCAEQYSQDCSIT